MPYTLKEGKCVDPCQGFVLAALLALPLGRKRMSCDHHVPSMWRRRLQAENGFVHLTEASAVRVALVAMANV